MNTHGGLSGRAWPSICLTRDLRWVLSRRGLSSSRDILFDIIGHRR